MAAANLFNITINVFTFGDGGDEDRWSEIKPDHELVSEFQIKLGKLLPDMALYHCVNTHFDLLIEDSEMPNLKPTHKEVLNAKSGNQEKQKTNNVYNFDEEGFITREKKNGFKRTSPASSFEQCSNQKVLFNCDSCGAKLESSGLLTAHIKSHDKVIPLSCDQCSTIFDEEENLQKHMTATHVKSKKFDDWNCNDCLYQGHGAPALLNHLKYEKHKPSPLVDKRSLFPDFKQCYTCHEEFDSYHSLMEHRKVVHPSNKKCRNFPTNCKYSSKECWYIHEEPMDVDSSLHSTNRGQSKFHCDFCQETFAIRREFMNHKKINHPDKVNICDKFLKGDCQRGEPSCWFKHTTENQKLTFTNSQVFRKAMTTSDPPDLKQLLNIMKDLSKKMEALESRIPK